MNTKPELDPAVQKLLEPLVSWLADEIAKRINPAPDSDELLPIRVAAQEMEVGQTVIRAAVTSGELRGYKPGKRVLVRRSDARAWAERRACERIVEPRRRRPVVEVEEEDWAAAAGLVEADKCHL